MSLQEKKSLLLFTPNVPIWIECQALVTHLLQLPGTARCFRSTLEPYTCLKLALLGILIKQLMSILNVMLKPLNPSI